MFILILSCVQIIYKIRNELNRRKEKKRAHRNREGRMTEKNRKNMNGV